MKTRVLITRPGKRGEVLAEALDASGFESVALDVVRYASVDLNAAGRGRLLDLDAYHGVIVVSPQAATCLAEAITSYWPQLPQGLRLYAVGQATARVLKQELGLPAVLPPAQFGEHSEGLLEIASLKAVAGKRLMLARGEGGRELLSEQLSERGAQVDSLVLYRRCLRQPAAVLRGWLERGEYAALVVTSAEILQHLATWCGPPAFERPLIVSSLRLAQRATALGFDLSHVASGVSPAALTDAVGAVCLPQGGTFDQGDHDKGKRR